MDRDWIRQKVNKTIYKRGMEIWRSGRVLDYSFQNIRDSIIYMQAQVQGSYDVYIVNITLNLEEMDIVYSMCDCPAFAQYPGLCKHCVAVLLEADEREMAEVLGLDFQEEDILEVLQNSLQEIQGAAKAPLERRKRKTTQELKELLDSRAQQKVLPLSQDNLYGKINSSCFP